MLGNTNRSLSLARERFPNAEFWALGSDHDLWEPRWLETTVALLDAHPEAVLAYSQTVRIDEDGKPYEGRRAPWRFDTAGLQEPGARMAAAFRGMVAGEMVYGLFRASALDELGRLYRPVLVPDRVMLSELALRGTFVQVHEVLWQRRFRGLAELDRQRRAFFLDGVPRYAKTPWWVQHTGALLLAYTVHGDFRPGISRVQGAKLAARYLRLSLAHRRRRRLLRLKRRVKRYRPRRILHRTLSSTLVRVGPSLGGTLRDLLVRLERNRVTRPLAARLRPGFDRTVNRLNARGRA
jgi:hypothetical protein